MKRMILAALIAAAVVSVSAADWTIVTDSGQQQAARADLEGTWSARLRIDEKSDGARVPRLQLQMNLDDERNWSNWGQSVPVSAFTNLPANLDAPQDVTFELRREAGVIRFQGRFESGRGVGHLFFTANREFERAMEQQTRDTFTDRDMFTFAIIDVSRAFIKELQSLGFADVTLDEARKLRIHGVTPQFIANMKAEGLQNPSLDEILKFRIHGVTADYVKEMRAAGLGTDLDDILQLRIHGVTTAYAKEMRAMGGATLDADDIKQLKIHGVTTAYVKEMRDAGFNESLDALKQARIHGVTPAYAREMAALGYKVGFDDLRKFRIHGITPAFVKELEAAGYKNLSDDELVDWAIHGRRLLKYRRK